MHPRVVIVGGGIAGLAAAHRLATQGVERISLLESSKELGGWMQSLLLCDEKGAEHVVEFGPRSVRDFGATLALAHHAGLADDVLCVPKGLSRMVKLEPNRPLFDVTGIKAMFQSDPSKAAALALEAAGSILRGPKYARHSTFPSAHANDIGQLTTLLHWTSLCGLSLGRLPRHLRVP